VFVAGSGWVLLTAQQCMGCRTGGTAGGTAGSRHRAQPSTETGTKISSIKNETWVSAVDCTVRR